jgi:hypothetical protein
MVCVDLQMAACQQQRNEGELLPTPGSECRKPFHILDCDQANVSFVRLLNDRPKYVGWHTKRGTVERE